MKWYYCGLIPNAQVINLDAFYFPPFARFWYDDAWSNLRALDRTVGIEWLDIINKYYRSGGHRWVE